MERCNPAGETNFTGVTVWRAEGQNKVTVRVDEYGRTRVRYWGEQIKKAWAGIRVARDARVKFQSNQTRNTNKTKGLGGSHKSKTKTPINATCDLFKEINWKLLICGKAEVKQTCTTDNRKSL